MIRCILGKSCHSADTLMQSPQSSSDIKISTKTVYQELRGKGFHDPCHEGSWSSVGVGVPCKRASVFVDIVYVVIQDIFTTFWMDLL